MKKLLELLGTVTIAGSSMLTVATTSLVSIQEKEIKLLDSEINYSKINSLESLKRNKRQTPPSLKNIITTINIGEIKKVNKNSVIKRLSEINHPILSRQDFLKNIEFEEITTNSAIVHFRNWELAPLPRTLTFTINFDSDIVNFNEILGITNENAILNLNTIENNRLQTIARQFIERNNLEHLLTVDDLIVTNLTSGSALIESSNINYILSIDVIFMPRYLSLRTFITSTDLGTLNDNSKTTIINVLEQENNLFHRGRNVRLEVRNITNNSAEISFNQATNSSSSTHEFHSTENFDYSDIITVTYSTAIFHLESIITNTDLGDIPNNSFQTVITEVIRANLNSRLRYSDIMIEHITPNSARITSNNPNFIGSVNVTFTPSCIDLSSIILNLGFILYNNHDHIINGLRLANFGWQWIDKLNSNSTIINVEDITPNSARITSNNPNFFGTANVTFTPTYINLSSVITGTNLGVLPDNNSITITNAVLMANPNSRLIYSSDIIVEHITPNSARITSNNPNFFGTANVTFTPTYINLSSVITDTNLGVLPDNNSITIMNAVLIANPNSRLRYSDLIVEHITPNSARITSNNHNYYRGNIEVFFSIGNNKRSQNFNDDEKDDKSNKQRKINHSTTPTPRPDGNNGVVGTSNQQKITENDHDQYYEILSRKVLNSNVNNDKLNLNPLQLKNNEYHFSDQQIEQISLKDIENLEINLIKNNNKIKQNVPVVNKPINKNIINAQITATKAINKYNALSKEEKLKKLNEINRYYQTLPENDKKAFKEKLTNTGLAALSGGALTAYGTKMTISGTTATSVTNAEAMEMTPLLSTSTTESLAAAETITVAETAAVEGGVIAGETGTAAAALAPETLGLSLVIGGLAIAGTWMYFAFHHHATSDIALPTSIHHNVYDNIEKWYKFLAHDKLKIKINKNTWNEIKQNKNSQANIIKIIKNKFVINDHSGWGGSVTNEDFNTFVKVIVLHFEQINGYFEILDNENDGFVIITNTEGDWLGIE
ncbi:hypothetical protein [Spiroplasma endosymbiont of Calodromius spilotus]|uniref:hypothetical protein n=1 Tax=Spiroplasma endosymbiont of Calodromius spilotus TaxID=3077929 RepID=UPI0031FEDC0A